MRTLGLASGLAVLVAGSAFLVLSSLFVAPTPAPAADDGSEAPPLLLAASERRECKGAPYKGRAPDGRCVYSCAPGTVPGVVDGREECVCKPGLAETGKDDYGRRICSSRAGLRNAEGGKANKRVKSKAVRPVDAATVEAWPTGRAPSKPSAEFSCSYAFSTSWLPMGGDLDGTEDPQVGATMTVTNMLDKPARLTPLVDLTTVYRKTRVVRILKGGKKVMESEMFNGQMVCGLRSRTDFTLSAGKTKRFKNLHCAYVSRQSMKDQRDPSTYPPIEVTTFSGKINLASAPPHYIGKNYPDGIPCKLEKGDSKLH